MLLQRAREQGRQRKNANEKLTVYGNVFDVNESLKQDQIPAVRRRVGGGAGVKHTKSPGGQGQSSSGYVTELWDVHVRGRSARLSGQSGGPAPHLDSDQHCTNMHTPEFIYIG